MSRYIDADKAKEKKVYSKDRHEYVVPVAELDWLPTADVQEVKHGKWELIGKNVSKCTSCGCARNIKTQFGWNFCPVCGERMGEEEQQ